MRQWALVCNSCLEEIAVVISQSDQPPDDQLVELPDHECKADAQAS